MRDRMTLGLVERFFSVNHQMDKPILKSRSQAKTGNVESKINVTIDSISKSSSIKDESISSSISMNSKGSSI